MVTEHNRDGLYEKENPATRAYHDLLRRTYENPYEAFGRTAQEIHSTAVVKGWWSDEPRKLIPEKILMIMTELAEAVDEYRNNKPDFYFLPEKPEGQATSYCFDPQEWHGEKPQGTAVELIDVLIRTLDLLEAMGVDIDTVLYMKMGYNSGRGYRHGNKLV